jgi:8-oxo-dGTP diphosphatase
MVLVVAAIIEKEDFVLLARRKFGKHLAGFWEFPGGKIEQNESPQESLKRELFEELELITEVGSYIGCSEYIYDADKIKLLGYKVTVISGDFNLVDHDKIEWVKIHDVLSYKLAPADIPIYKLYYNERITKTNNRF